ncbi:hypothetical protein ACTA71_009579 [Dictyostelium dimigraforme]
MIGNRLPNFFKISKQINKPIYFRSYSISKDNLIKIKNDTINYIDNNNNIINNINNINSIDNNNSNQDKDITISMKGKKTIKSVDYSQKEANGTLAIYFNSFKDKRREVLEELDLYFGQLLNPLSAQKLYENLHGSLKKNPVIVNRFLRYFGEKMNVSLFHYILNTYNINYWDSETWYQVLKFRVKGIILKKEGANNSVALEDLERELRTRRIEYTNKILGVLIDYYLYKGEYHVAKFYTKLLKMESRENSSGNDTTKKVFPFSSLTYFIESVIDIIPMETIEVIKTLIRRNGSGMIENIKFAQIIHLLVKSNRTDEFIDIWQSIPEKSKTLLAYNRVIEYFALVEKDLNFANFFLDKLTIENHIPNLQSIDPILKTTIEANKSYTSIKKVLKTLNVLKIDYPPHLSYWILKHSTNEKERETLAFRLVNDPESFARIFLVCERINDELHNQIKSLLLDSSTKVNRGHQCIDAIIFECLYADDFQSALSWYSIKIKSFQMFSTIDVLLAFVLYHRRKNEDDLAEHFQKRLDQVRYSKSDAPKVSQNFHHNLFDKDRLDSIQFWLTEKSKVEKVVDSIGDYVDDGSSDSGGSITKSKHFKQNLLFLRNSINISRQKRNNQLEKLLQPKNNFSEIKVEFEDTIKNNRLPPLETLFKMLDSIYLSNPSGFIPYILSLNQSSVLLLTYCYSTIVKFDIEYGLIQMEPAFKATSLTISLWSALLINSIRQGNFYLTLKTLNILNKTKKILTSQALFILGQEIQNIRFKKNNINFNYNENVKLDYYEIGNNASNLFNSNEDGKIKNYYLNKIGQPEADYLYQDKIVFHKNNLFSLYQKIHGGGGGIGSGGDSIDNNSGGDIVNGNNNSNNNNNNDNSGSIGDNSNSNQIFNHYLTPFINSCISVLIDTGDFVNANLVISRLITSGDYNRETLLLLVEIHRKSNQINEDSQISHILNNTLKPLAKSLDLSKEDLYHLCEDSKVYENAHFIRRYLSIPQINQICELRNQINSFSVLVDLDKTNEERVIELVENYKFI